MQIIFASSSPFGAEATSLRGYVDEISENGIKGWAIDLDDVSTPVQLDILVEGTAVYRCRTEYERSDLARFLGSAARPGFSFGPGALDALRRLLRVIPNARLWVQVVGRNLALRSELGVPTLALIFNGTDRQPWETGARDLLARLSRHRAELGQRMLRPFQPSVKSRIGFIEAVMPDRAFTWLIGWLRRTEVTDQPVVILDRQKIPAALAFFTFERDDLPPSDCGFIGLLVGDWVPSPASQAHLFLGENQLTHLEALRPLPILSSEAFGERFEDHLSSAAGLNVRLLQQVLLGAESWAVQPAALGFSAEAAVDRLLVLPNFGVLVEGWVLCSSKHWKTFALRFGNTVLACDPATTRRKPRKDLLEAAGGDGRAESAGFTAALVGLLQISEIDRPILKVVYEDGTTSNHLVDPGAITRLSPDAIVQAALGLFPALAAESFFPAFARGVIEDLGPLTRTWSPQKISPAERVIILTVGRDRSGARSTVWRKGRDGCWRRRRSGSRSAADRAASSWSSRLGLASARRPIGSFSAFARAISGKSIFMTFLPWSGRACLAG